jgi:hypothetical protein
MSRRRVSWPTAFGEQIIPQLWLKFVLKLGKYSGWEMPMRNGFYLVLTMVLVSTPMAFGQAGTSRDLRADEQQLQHSQWQLEQDQGRLSFDRQHHASRGLIHEDQARVRHDRDAIRRLRADIRRDRRLRRRHYAML